MFEIKIQKSLSEKNMLTKSISDIMTLRGVLKDKTSIIDPVIIIETSNTNIFKCNYISIPTFGRSYFVNNITSVKNNLIELECHVDVLSSFKEQILKNHAVITRQENSWNLYINDPEIQVSQKPKVLTRNFPDGFTGRQYILTIAG